MPKLDVYAIDGSDVCIKSKKLGNEVYRNCCYRRYLHVKTTALYEDSAMSKVLDIHDERTNVFITYRKLFF